MSGSIHDELEDVRRPRVHIKYEVFTDGAREEKELPFVVGVMGDYSGNAPTKKLDPLKDRKFIQIDRDNFNQVLARMAPGLKFRVENTLENNGTELPVELKIRSMDDFEPANVVQQIEPLKELMEKRNKLRDLLTQIDRSDKLENLLDQILAQPDQQQKVREELDSKKPTPPPAG